MYDFDLFVIGAGSGGIRAARMAADRGARVAIAEERYLGGTCVNVGCIPKKLYSYASHFHYDFEDSLPYGWSCPDISFDWTTLRENKKREISRLNNIYAGLLETSGCRQITGRATIAGPHAVTVAGEAVTARHILIATGGWPYVPDFPGCEYAITSNEVFDLESFPERILIVGGGYVAVEFAGIFAGLGSRTVLSYRDDLLLKGFDHDVRRFYLTEAARYIDLKLKSNVEQLARTPAGTFLVKFANGGDMEVDSVLYATGRKPNTQDLGLENTAVELDERGYIKVDDHYRTDEPSIHALGDVIGRIELTPVAIAEAMILVDRLFSDGSASLDYDTIPTTVFSHPNIGTVGLTEEEARERYSNIAIYKADFRLLKHTISGRVARTFMKVLVNREDDKVLGIHMVGDDAGEIIQGFAVAMNCGLTKSQLDRTVGIHPTAAEELVTLREAFVEQPN